MWDSSLVFSSLVQTGGLEGWTSCCCGGSISHYPQSLWGPTSLWLRRDEGCVLVAAEGSLVKGGKTTGEIICSALRLLCFNGIVLPQAAVAILRPWNPQPEMKGQSTDESMSCQSSRRQPTCRCLAETSFRSSVYMPRLVQCLYKARCIAVDSGCGLDIGLSQNRKARKIFHVFIYFKHL